MPIDVDKAVSADWPVITHAWDRDDIILYHLGVGAGADWVNPDELKYTYEKGLHVLPAYAVIPPHHSIGPIIQADFMDFPPYKTVHGEHEITIHGPIPPQGDSETTTKVVGCYDKGSGALLIVENTTRLKGETAPLFTNRWSLFIRGETGRGEDPDPRPAAKPPGRAPDIVKESPVLHQLAQLYRLNGDKIPFHIDPSAAKAAGFETPILHGLCTFGIVCKAVVDGALDYDVSRLRRFRGRFAKPVFPGETLITQIWREPTGLVVNTLSKERNEPVFANAFVDLAG